MLFISNADTTYNIERYVELFPRSKILRMSDPIPHGGETIMLIASPDKETIKKVQELVGMKRRFICMVKCTSLVVLPIYKDLLALSDTFAVPSDFCKRVFQSIYPRKHFNVIRPYISVPAAPTTPRMFDQSKYIFYTIADPFCKRKQVNMIIQAFNELNLPNSLLVVKSTANITIKSGDPRIIVLNGELSNENIDELHNSCHCYVNFSKSESTGGGLLEAAMWNKPIIMSKYGGAPEHVKTPFLIGCKRKLAGYAEYHFTKDTLWGNPCYDSLM